MDMNLPADQQHAVYRVLQEALTNARRHAAASEVTITLGQAEEEFRLVVEDNGKGLPPLVESGAGLGVGIPGMRARLAQFGGAVDIASVDGGTVVRARIPTRLATPRL
jgi:signal transduction histidine kinase